jgi:ribose transport system permease protein
LRAPSEVGIFTVLILVVVILCIMSPSFRTFSNALSLLLNGAVIAFLTLGQMLVLLTGGIDLSAGATVALTGVAAAMAMAYGAPWWVGVIVALALGLLVGAVNGFIIHYGRVPAFIATFAMMGVASAIPMVLTNAASLTVVDGAFSVIGQGKILSVPVPVVLLGVAACIVAVALARTKFGVHVYAMGGSAPAARLAGINIGRNIVTVYALSGFFAAIGGLILTSRLMVGYPSAGLGNELFYSIAGAVVGGVSLFGGVGTVGGAMIGAVLIATVTNGLNVLNVNSYWQSFVIGIIILAGVFYDTNRARLRGIPLAKRLYALTRRGSSSDA